MHLRGLGLLALLTTVSASANPQPSPSSVAVRSMQFSKLSCAHGTDEVLWLGRIRYDGSHRPVYNLHVTRKSEDHQHIRPLLDRPLDRQGFLRLRQRLEDRVAAALLADSGLSELLRAYAVPAIQRSNSMLASAAAVTLVMALVRLTQKVWESRTQKPWSEQRCQHAFFWPSLVAWFGAGSYVHAQSLWADSEELAETFAAMPEGDHCIEDNYLEYINNKNFSPRRRPSEAELASFAQQVQAVVLSEAANLP